MTTARLEWSTFLFTLDPRPSVLLQRPEALRRLGAEFLVTDPQDAGSLDADRYAFALLAYRLLVSHVPVGVLDCHRQRVIPGLLPAQDRRIWQLWERSAGPEGTRPRIAEWWPALGEINELSVLGAMGGR